MKFKKKRLDTMERCYAASVLEAAGGLYAVLASEARGGPCYAYTGADFSRREVVWESAGGTMSLLQIPGADGEFVAIQRFFPGFQSEDAVLVRGKRDERGAWAVEALAHLPYVHRFDMFNVGGDVHILAATLCGSKRDREDWSDPGRVLAGKLPRSSGEGVSFIPVLENLYKNHGYCRGRYDGRDAGFITCEDGIYALLPPESSDGAWGARKIMDGAVGDAAFCDLDGDGTDELVTIEPFHGDAILVRKKIDGVYREVWRCPGDIRFAHAVTACTLRGEPSVVCGARRGDGGLFVLQRGRGEEWGCVTLVEQGVGPSNVAVMNLPRADVIISANHSLNEAALYFVTD